MTIPTDDEDSSMKGDPQRRAHEQTKVALSNEAAEWFVRLRDDRLGARHRERNVRWLKQSPAHIAELLRIQQVYKALRAAKLESSPPGPPGESRQAQASNVVELMPHLLPAPPTRPIQSRARFETWKVAASVACLSVSLLLGFMVKVAWLDRTLETDLGEWRTAMLTDGTQVRIGPGSLLRVAFGDDHRTVRLVRGEAMFDVAKDHSRPFFVASEMVGVLAVGTEFRVSRRGGEDVVAVSEGTVAVYNDGRQEIRGEVLATPAQVAVATGGVALTAGEQASVTKAKPVAKQKLNVDYETAWVDGWLIYEDKTVAEVASEFNRRNRVKIVIDNPFVAARRLAFFRGSATDPESFVAALAVDANIKIVRDEPGVLRVQLTPDIDNAAQGESEPPPPPSGNNPV